MSDTFFIDHTWKLSRENGQVIAPALKFYKNGIVGGHVNLNERCWSFDGKELCLKDISGITTTKFLITKKDNIGIAEMRGLFYLGGKIKHTLERVEMPSLVHYDDNSAEKPAIKVIRNGKKLKRKNLVFIPAGPKSLHFSWPKYINDVDRNWDICVNWYGADFPTNLDFGEYFCHQERTQKFNALYHAIRDNDFLLDYENFWLPDDDLETSWKDINRLFNIFSRFNMALAQPSLSIESSSFPNHSITIQNRKYYLRFTNFVELMCPVFSQEMLKACLPVFNKTQGAYCLDHIWGGIEGRVPGRMGIIDDVAVTHTRPIGMNYDGSVAMEEGRKLSSLYFNIDDRYDVVGKIYRKNTIL